MLDNCSDIFDYCLLNERVWGEFTEMPAGASYSRNKSMHTQMHYNVLLWALVFDEVAPDRYFETVPKSQCVI